jgi:hypothetical protein
MTSIFKLVTNSIVVKSKGHSAEHNVRVMVDICYTGVNGSYDYVNSQVEFVTTH